MNVEQNHPTPDVAHVKSAPHPGKEMPAPACSVVQPLNNIPTVAAAVVRNAQHAPGGQAFLPPICSNHCDANAPMLADIQTAEDTCSASPGSLSVPFDTRSYLLSTYRPGECADTRFGALHGTRQLCAVSYEYM